MIQHFIQIWLERWRSLAEIILLSVGIYYGYLYFRGTRGAKVLTGLAIVFLTLTLISQLLNLVVIGWIIRSFSVFLAVALVVIFQPELRRGLAELGGHPIFSLTSEKRETVHDIAEAVTQLANLLRYSLQSGQLETVPFEDELRIVNDYLALEQVRHEERLRVRLDVDPATLTLPIPPMLLQTLVENAVKYGISTRPEGGEIAIVARLEAGRGHS